MRNVGRGIGSSRRPGLPTALALCALVSLALGLSACGGSGGTTSETTSGTTGGAASQEAEAGAQVYAAAGCGSCHTFAAAGSTGTTGPNLNEYLEPADNKPGIEEMIVDPNAEIAEGYKANVMPQDFGESLSTEEIKDLVEFLYENSPASEGAKGEQSEQAEEGK